MTHRPPVTDQDLRDALRMPSSMRAPADLAGDIRAIIDTTPQVRPGILGRFRRRRPSRPTRLLLAFGMLALLALGALGASVRWVAPDRMIATYHGGPDHLGVLPGPGPIASPFVEWTRPAGPVGAWSPVVVDGTAYLSDSRGILAGYAIDGMGTEVLSVDLGAPAAGAVSIADGLLLAPDVDGTVHAIDRATGTVAWNADVRSRVNGPPAVTDGAVFVGTAGGTVHALDLRTGAARWVEPAQLPGPILRAIAASGGTLVVGSAGASATDPGRLAALDAGSGAVRWTVDLQPGAPSTPTIADGWVIVTQGLDAPAAGGRRLEVFSLADGRRGWADAFVGREGESLYLAAVADGTIHVATSSGRAIALDLATGAVRWETTLAPGESPNGGVADGVLYLTGLGTDVHALDAATGERRWSLDLGAPSRAPAVVDGRVIVATTDGEVIAIAGAD
jgi:outer membrane protein assembly factor BamB